jgi:hypothetical protein
MDATYLFVESKHVYIGLELVLIGNLLMCTQDLHATSEVDSDREEAEQKSECSISQPVAVSSAASTAHPALQPVTPSIEDSKPPALKYPLPPTEIHDGRLFRKVG